jgi:single-strand DNA-binding protein
VASLNKWFGMGRLTRDVEVRRTPQGKAVADLGVAVNKQWKGRDGERREEALFIDVVVWEKTAENCEKYLRKGSQIHIIGELINESWVDKNTGEKKSRLKVRADEIQFLDGRQSDQQDEQPRQQQAEPRREPQQRQPEPQPSAEEFVEDDIPF